MLIALLIDVYLSRMLGPSLKGEYFLIITFITQASIISTLGIEYSFPNCSKEKRLDDCFIQTKYWFNRSVLISIVLTCFFYFAFLSSTTPLFIPLLVAVVLLEVIFIWNNQYKVASNKITQSIYMRYARRIFFLVILSVLFIFDLSMGVIAIVLVYLLSLIFVYFIFFPDYINKRIANYEKRRPIDIDLIWIKVMSFLLNKGAVFLAAIFLGSFDVGILSVALAFLEVMMFLPNTLTLYLFSIMGHNDTDYKHKRNKISIYLIILVLLQSICVVLFSDNVVAWLYGPEFLDSIELVNYYIVISLLLAPAVVIVSNSLRYKDRAFLRNSLICSTSLFLIFGSYFANFHGTMGIVFAQLVSIMVFLFIIFFSKRIKGSYGS